jgi:hypothetical protein
LSGMEEAAMGMLLIIDVSENKLGQKKVIQKVLQCRL